MKKAIVLLLALAVLGGAVFAQDAAIKFSGYIDTGIAVDIVGSGDPTVALYGEDSGSGSRLNLVASYTNGNVGAYARYRVQGDFNNSKPVVWLNRGYVWVDFLDGIVKTKVGKLDDYSWSTAGNDFGNFDTMTGFQLQIKPIEGLNFGVMLPVGSDLVPVVVLEDALSDTNIGAAYDIEGLGGFRAGVDLSPVSDSTMAYFGAEITAVESFVFYVDYKATDIGNDVTGSHYLWWEADYTMDALNVGIDLEQMFFAIDDAPIGLSFTPYVNYTVGDFVPGLAFGYYMSTETDTADSQSGLYFNPRVQYNAGTALIELGGKINTGDISAVDVSDIDSYLVDDTYKFYLSYTLSF